MNFEFFLISVPLKVFEVSEDPGGVDDLGGAADVVGLDADAPAAAALFMTRDPRTPPRIAPTVTRAMRMIARTKIQKRMPHILDFVVLGLSGGL